MRMEIANNYRFRSVLFLLQETLARASFSVASPIVSSEKDFVDFSEVFLKIDTMNFAFLEVGEDGCFRSLLCCFMFCEYCIKKQASLLSLSANVTSHNRLDDTLRWRAVGRVEAGQSNMEVARSLQVTRKGYLGCRINSKQVVLSTRPDKVTT
ncbi:hypothetical protein TNCV_841231 [Trichonephila clavipes]|nr:hypothetical protein TNCV_841231 [Trichonephila clavipes]